jgi:hypothetical protein
MLDFRPLLKEISEIHAGSKFYGGLSRKVRVSLQGVSIVRTDNGKITDWSDYYDGLASRRTALASHFTEWVEL